MRSVLNRAHRSFRPGEVALAEVTFTPHLLGGTYRLVASVTSIDGRRILHGDTGGVEASAPTREAAGGLVDLDATFRFVTAR